MRKVFATSWHPGGANAIAPAIKRLIAEGKIDVIVFGHEFSEPIFAKAGIPFKTFQEGFWEKIWRIVLNIICFIFTWRWVFPISPARLRKILDKEKPDLVITGTASQEDKSRDILEHAVIIVARRLGIPSLAVLDFWDGTGNYYKRFTDERDGVKFALLPDYLAVMDDVAKEEMLDEGFPEDRLVVTGQPYFDNLPEKARLFTQEQRNEVRRKMGLEGNTLFFFGGNGFKDAVPYTGYWDLDIVRTIADSLPKLPDVGVAARLHPRMPDFQKDEIRELIANSGANMKLVSDIDSQTLSLAADMTIVAFSTLGLEAVYMRRPCVSFQPDLMRDDQLIVSRKGLIPAGYDAQTCKDLLVKATDPVWRQETLKKSAGFTTDGKATDRVVELVYSVLFSDKGGTHESQ